MNVPPAAAPAAHPMGYTALVLAIQGMAVTPIVQLSLVSPKHGWILHPNTSQ